MKIENKKWMLWIMVLISITNNISCYVSEAALFNGNKSTKSVENNTSEIHGKVVSDIIVSETSKPTINYALPNIWLEFKKNSSPHNESNNEKVQLPPEALIALSEHWVNLLNYHSTIKQRSNSVTVDYYKLDIQISQSTVDTKSKLEKVIIASPTGSRHITNQEARELVRFLSKTANSIIK